MQEKLVREIFSFYFFVSLLGIVGDCEGALLLPFLPIDKPRLAVDAEKILAINVGSKSTIFFPDGGSQ
tara:strand:- start:53 stop:256 length:204 start_codon:yes stop_codon:yes gene_type:complete